MSKPWSWCPKHRRFEDDCVCATGAHPPKAAAKSKAAPKAAKPAKKTAKKPAKKK